MPRASQVGVGSVAVLNYENVKERLDLYDTFSPEAIVITPLLALEGGDDAQLTPAGIDLRLDTRFRQVDARNQSHIDITKPHREYTVVELDIDDKEDVYIIHPGDMVLGQSLEYVRIPNNLVGTVDGRSSMGRLGLTVHSTASCVDPGFQGHLVFELSNVGHVPIVLRPFIRVARLVFHTCQPTEHPYKGKYQFQLFVRPTKPDKKFPSLGG